MVLTAVCERGLVEVASGDHLAVGLSQKDSLVLAGPIMPQPMTPMVMRSEAGARREVRCAKALPRRLRPA